MKQQTFAEWTQEHCNDIMYNDTIIAKLIEWANIENSHERMLHFDFPYNCHLLRFDFIFEFENSPNIFRVHKTRFTHTPIQNKLDVLEYVWAYLED